MKKVGVIIPTYHRFREYVARFKKENTEYIYLRDLHSVRGIHIDEIIKSDDWYEVKNADEILYQAERRIR